MGIKSKKKQSQVVQQTRVGIDIGRVIINATDPNGRSDTSFLSGGDARAMETPPVPGAFEVIRELVEFYEGRVWLVSKCGARVQKRSRAWLSHHRCYERTGMTRAQLRFCPKRPDKAIHCRQLRLTHFVDDRLDVLRHLRGVTDNRYLFGHQKYGTIIPHWVTPVMDWSEVRSALLPADMKATG